MRARSLLLAAAAAVLTAQTMSLAQTATGITLGTNPVDVQDTVDNLWGFVASPLGIMMAFGLVLAIVGGLYRLVRRPARGKL